MDSHCGLLHADPVQREAMDLCRDHKVFLVRPLLDSAFHDVRRPFPRHMRAACCPSSSPSLLCLPCSEGHIVRQERSRHVRHNRSSARTCSALRRVGSRVRNLHCESVIVSLRAALHVRKLSDSFHTIFTHEYPSILPKEVTSPK